MAFKFSDRKAMEMALQRGSEIYTKSDFFVLLNTGTGKKAWDSLDEQYKKKYIRTLVGCLNHIKGSINRYIKKPLNNNTPYNLTNYDFYIEVGANKKMIHCHGIISLDKYGFIDWNKMNLEVQKYFIDHGIPSTIANPHFLYRVSENQIDSAKAYARKGKVKIV